MCSQAAQCANGLYSELLVLVVEKGFHGSAKLLIRGEGNHVEESWKGPGGRILKALAQDPAQSRTQTGQCSGEPVGLRAVIRLEIYETVYEETRCLFRKNLGYGVNGSGLL